ncbi:MAG: copper amine oxidase N-terminal domain-containing protein, partial [Oscillospiraceae bacterium]|nr:copper amine oxidase N-terminal domain-containing protein [Oscillospiraceae bacterium]
MVLAQVFDRMAEEQWQAHLDAQKKAMGGEPGQIGVMVNGKYIQFPDAAPEITEGRTMVPVRALAEALGGKAEQTDGKVVCGTDEVRLTFTPGSAEVLVEYPGGELPGDGQIFPLDCAPYIKDGRTYVPARFLGEALGYTVGWDSAFETVVLLDAEALAAEIDKDFTIYNKVLANVARDFEEGKSYSAELKWDAALTTFDTLNGNASYTSSLAGEELFDSNAANGSYTLTMSDGLADLLVDALISEGMPKEEIEPLRAVMEKIELSFIMTREGLLWAHSPLLD